MSIITEPSFEKLMVHNKKMKIGIASLVTNLYFKLYNITTFYRIDRTGADPIKKFQRKTLLKARIDQSDKGT